MEKTINIISFEGFSAKMADGVYISASSQIIGQVNLAKDCSIWPYCVLRGDINSISIGARSNIQDLSLLHVTNEYCVTIGSEVTIGHKVIAHGCQIGDNSLIGMGAILLDGCKIGKNSLVAAGSLVTPGKVFPDGVLIMGHPAKIVRQLTSEEKRQYGNHYLSYIALKNRYLNQ